MNRREIKRAEITELVKAYSDAAVDHGRASAVGDYMMANLRAKELISIYQELRARGREAQGALLPILENHDANARLWAAVHALEFAPERSEPVLVQLASGPNGPSRLDAEWSLRQWREGTLRFP